MKLEKLKNAQLSKQSHEIGFVQRVQLKSGGYEGLTDIAKKEKVKEDFNNFIQKRALYVMTAISILVDGRDIDSLTIIKNHEVSSF